MLRYIERNPVRAGLVESAQDWPWSSAAAPQADGPPLDPGPVALPRNWLEHVNEAQTEAEVESLRECLRRGRPFGDGVWMEKTAQRLGLEASLRPRGRPKKTSDAPDSLFGREATVEK